MPNPSRCVRNQCWLLRNSTLDGISLSLQGPCDICDTSKAEEIAPTLDGLVTFCSIPENLSVGKQTEIVSQCLLL